MKRVLVGLCCLGLALGGSVSGQTAKQKEEVEYLLKQLKTAKEGKARASAANELRELALVRVQLVKPAEAPLVEALKDPDPEVRRAVAAALITIEPYPKARAAALLPLLKDGEDRNAKLAAVYMVGRTVGGAPEAVPLLEEIAKKENDKEQNMRDGDMLRQVNEALVGIRAHLLAGFMTALKDGKEAKERAQAAEELTKIARTNAEQAKPAAPLLAAALDDDDVSVRKAAMTALTVVRAEPQAVVPNLIAIVKNNREDKGLRLAAVNMLAANGGNARPALPYLEFLLEREGKKTEADRDKELHDSLLKAVETIKK